MHYQVLKKCPHHCGRLHAARMADVRVCPDEIRALRNVARRFAKENWLTMTKDQLRKHFFKKYPRARKIARRARRIGAI